MEPDTNLTHDEKTEEARVHAHDHAPKNSGFNFQAAFLSLFCAEMQGRLSNPKEPNRQAGVIADSAWDHAVTMSRKFEDSDPGLTTGENTAKKAKGEQDKLDREAAALHARTDKARSDKEDAARLALANKPLADKENEKTAPAVAHAVPRNR